MQISSPTMVQHFVTATIFILYNTVLNYLSSEMFQAVTGKQRDKIHILRIYGRSIERQDYPGPYKDCDIFGEDKKTFFADDNCKSFALHHLVRTQSPLKDEILKLENSFRNSKASLPPSEERYRYRRLLIEAEENVIRAGNFDVVLCTCNEASSYRVHRNILPLQCIIDEASMCTEPETMAAVSSAKHVVLLGDHMQLAPVVKSEIARRNGMERSLFKRYVELFQKYYPGGCKHFICLETQYRMVRLRICVCSCVCNSCILLNEPQERHRHFCLIVMRVQPELSIRNKSVCICCSPH